MPSHRADTPTSRRRHDRTAAPRRATAHRPAAGAALLTRERPVDVYDTDALYSAVYGSVETWDGADRIAGLDAPAPAAWSAPNVWETSTSTVVPPRFSPVSPLVPTEPSEPELPALFVASGPAVVDLTSVETDAAAPVGTPAAPRTRAELRAAQGRLTTDGGAQPSRASRRVAERARTKTAKPGVSLPQVGIAGVLGLATIAAPLAGALAAPAAKTAAEPLPLAAAPSVAFPRVEAPAANAVEEAKLVPAENDLSSVPRTLAAPRSIIVTRASRGTERSVLPGCDGRVPAGADWANGRIPARDLCTLWEKDHSLRADAAVALAKLNIAYKKRFGRSICLTDSYRNLSDQYRLRSIKPGLAAVPGTSQHGWGLAVDLCGGIDDFGSTTYRWMRANAPAYGWDNPDWALPGGSGPTEPWHWEYLPGEKVGPGSE